MKKKKIYYESVPPSERGNLLGNIVAFVLIIGLAVIVAYAIILIVATL